MAVQTKLFLHGLPEETAADFDMSLANWEGIATFAIKNAGGDLANIGDACHVFDGKLFLASCKDGQIEEIERALAESVVDFDDVCCPVVKFAKSPSASLSMRDVIEIPQISGRSLILVSKVCGTNDEGIDALRNAIDHYSINADVEYLEFQDSMRNIGAMSAITPIGYGKVLFQPRFIQAGSLKYFGLELIDCAWGDLTGASGLMMRNYANPTARLLLAKSNRRTIRNLRRMRYKAGIDLIVDPFDWNGTDDLASIYVECDVN
jgi:hypothetical protein